MKKYFIAILLSLGLGYLGGYFLPASFTGPAQQMLGGVRVTADHFVSGLFAGRNDEFAVDQDGNVTVNNLTVNGTCTGSGCGSGGSASSTFITVCDDATRCDFVATSTDAQIGINLAITNANLAAGFGGQAIVHIVGRGSSSPYTISEPIKIKRNVVLEGDGIDNTIIKAEDSYNPSSLNFANGKSMIMDFGQTPSATTTGGVSNIEIRGITFDHNVANSGLGAGTSIHRTVYIRNSTNVKFIDNEIKNFWSWATDFDQDDQLWIERNRVLADSSSTLTNHDGIHVSDSTNFWVKDNYIDTLNGTTAGDDAIAIQQFTDGYPVTNVHVEDNTVKSSGSRGILFVVRNEIISNVSVKNNIVNDTYSSGIKFYTVSGDGSTGKYVGVNISGNELNNIRDTGGAGEVSAGIQLLGDPDAGRVFYEHVQINNNKIRGVNLTTSKGIEVTGKTIGLQVNDNEISNMSGTHGIHLGSASNPIKDYTANDNNIDLASSTTNSIGILLYGTERGNTQSNTISGVLTGTTYGILLQAKATAGNDAQGIANAETSAYNNVSFNNVYNFDNGVVEQNDGASPNLNQIGFNTFNGVVNHVSLLGTNSRFFLVGTSTPFSLGNATTTAGLLGVMSQAGLTVSVNTGATVFGAENKGSSGSAAGSIAILSSNDGAAMASGDRLGGFLFGGSSSATALRNTAGIFAFTSEGWTDASAYGTGIRFETTANGSTSRTAKMELTGDGYLGIGTSTPSTFLGVVGTDVSLRVGEPVADKTGCFQNYAPSATTTLMYYYADLIGGTPQMVATSTKPSFCQ